MAGEYTVKILNPEEFGKLPFKRIRENPESIYGAADKKNRIAYVKDTGFNDLTKANIGHELDELLAQTSEHEEDGIRYKDFSQAWGNFGGSIPMIGGLAKPLMGAVGQVPDLIGGGIGKLFGGGAKPATTNLFSAPALRGSGAADEGMGNVLGSKLPGFQKTGGSQLVPLGNKTGGVSVGNAAPNVFSSMFQQSGAPTGSIGTNRLPRIASPYPGFSTPSLTTPTTQTQSTPQNNALDLGGMLKSAAPGAAVSLLGNLFAPKVQVPDFSGIREDLRSKMGAEGGSPAYNLGFGEASRILNAPFGEVPQEMFDPIDLRLRDEITALEDRFRSNQQSGAMSESDTSQFGRLRAQLVDQANKEKSQLEFQYRQQQEANRINTMQTVLNLDTAQFNQYAQLAELDMAELMMKTGIDQQTATDFKTLFGNIGGQMIQKGLYPEGERYATST